MYIKLLEKLYTFNLESDWSSSITLSTSLYGSENIVLGRLTLLIKKFYSTFNLRQTYMEDMDNHILDIILIFS